MATKRILTVYDGFTGLLKDGDITPDGLRASEAASIGTKAESMARLAGAATASTAEVAESLSRIGGSIARAAESQGLLDNSLAERAESLGRRASSYAHALDGETAYSFALVADSMAQRAESVGRKAESLARLAEETSEISEAASMAMFATQTIFNIAASGAGGSRKGFLVYKNAVTGEVALAKANSLDTMPAIGVIIEDLNTTCKVGSLNAPYNISLDSAAANTPVAGAKMFVSRLQGGRATESVATAAESAAGKQAVSQFIGTANGVPAAGKVATIFNIGTPISL